MLTRICALIAACAVVAGCAGASGGSSQTPSSAAAGASIGAATPSAIPVASSSESPASPSPSPAPSTAASGPAKPGDATFDLVKETPLAEGTTREDYRITWTYPKGAATSFLLYGVVGCLRASAANNDTPCVTKGMEIPKSELVLLKTIAGDKRATTITWELSEIPLPPYSAILIRARSAAGDSIFTIVHSEDVCWQCTY